MLVGSPCEVLDMDESMVLKHICNTEISGIPFALTLQKLVKGKPDL
jgi:hypothetical protein